jgi:hypothetical protein
MHQEETEKSGNAFRCSPFPAGAIDGDDEPHVRLDPEGTNAHAILFMNMNPISPHLSVASLTEVSNFAATVLLSIHLHCGIGCL